MSSRLAILGTGKMGAALATRLEELSPTLWNRTRERAERLRLGKVAENPAAAVREAEVVISCLTGAAALAATYRGPSGALAGAAGQLFIEMSTAGPEIVEEVGAEVRGTGSAIVDAPIMGSPAAVLRGSAAILVGGDPADVERSREVLERLGEFHPVGALGSASRIKLLANSLLATISAEAAELLAAGEAQGLEPEEVFWALSRLAPALELRRRGYLEEIHEPAMFTARDLLKDLDLALGSVHRTEASAPLTALVRELVAEAVSLGPELDMSSLRSRYRSRR